MMQTNNILVVSDTHGDLSVFQQIKQSKPYHYIFHCGDYCVDPIQMEGVEYVRGNNDFDLEVPFERIIDIEGVTIYLTHGHLQQVDYSLLRLAYAAEEKGAQLILFGHTHYPLTTMQDDKIFINPGSLKRPRGYTTPTYAELTLEHIGQYERNLIVCYYTPTGDRVEALDKSYIIKLKAKS